jgi:ubiquinol-cytochrome c reductase iron-sulfur subunit
MSEVRPPVDEWPPPPDRDRAHQAALRSGWPVLLGVLLILAGSVAFVWAYVDDADTQWLGISLGVAMTGFGLALGYWGRSLIGDSPGVDRYPVPFEEEPAATEASDDLREDLKPVTRRRFLLGTLIGAAAVFAASQIVLAGSLGPRPRRSRFTTAWREGMRLVTPDGTPIDNEALRVGAFVVAFPEGHTDAADSQVVLLRLGEAFVPQPGREDWSPDGYVAYSRLCTHAGCAVAQYEDEARVLLCPCHQSAFDVLQGARPVSGPAARPLPQLPLAVDGQGFLVARADFDEPVGAGVWDQP